MQLQQAIEQRRSIRMFSPRPVPRETIEAMIKKAIWAPSWGNTQPWEIIAVDGPVLAEFKRQNRQASLDGKESKPDIDTPKKWPEPLITRYQEVGKSVLAALKIERGDKQGRIKYYGEMNYLFDAPALLMFVAKKELNLEYTVLDCGLLIQNICLLAEEEGLGTCLLAASINYPEIAHRLLAIPEDRKLIVGMAIGWPERDALVNSFERKRGALDEFLRWV
ncbi:MAG: nitroreductase [Deltaproteobacteria bacterium]|nr:nitroreductase [Deltaproteobacteria bacterium]